MKSFLENRASIATTQQPTAAKNAPTGFQSMGSSKKQEGASSKANASTEALPANNPEDPNAPKVDLIRNDAGHIARIKITYNGGKDVLKLDCAYEA